MAAIKNCLRRFGGQVSWVSTKYYTLVLYFSYLVGLTACKLRNIPAPEGIGVEWRCTGDDRLLVLGCLLGK